MASSGSGLLPENGVWGHAPPSAFGRAAASPQTRQMRCWPSSERTTNPSSRRKRQDSRSLSLVLFPPKPLRWVSAGALLGAVIKTLVLYFLHFCVGGITYPPVAVAMSEQPRAGFISAEKRLSQSGCSVPTNALFPPAHSAFLAPLCGGGGIITLGVRFMPLKRWTPAGHDGVFAVFMLPRNSPCVGRISPRRVQRHPSPNRAHSGSQGETRGGFPARDIGRVDRVNSLGTLCIVTFGTAQFDEPLSVAAAHHGGNTDFA